MPARLRWIQMVSSTAWAGAASAKPTSTALANAVTASAIVRRRFSLVITGSSGVGKVSGHQPGERARVDDAVDRQSGPLLEGPDTGLGHPAEHAVDGAGRDAEHGELVLH